MPKPPRIAILGGGPAGLSAAYHLTRIYEARKEPFDITVYQLGWRLGGKAATGRDPAKHHRIEEHGIHGFCKFYFHAWEMMRTVYAEVPPADLLVEKIDEAFLASSTVYRVENIDGAWTSEIGHMPEGPGHPWDGKPDLGKAAILLGILESLWRRDRDRRLGPFDASDLLARPASAAMKQAAQALHEIILRTYERAREKLTALERSDGEALMPVMEEAHASLDGGRPHLEMLFQQKVEPSSNVQIHRALTALDLGLALFRGLVRAQFWSDRFDLDDLDAYDYREWLERHGASEQTRASAAVITVANMLFAYPEGDTTRAPELSAASWLNWVLRSVVGRGAYFYMFAAGSGETVLLPLYEYLRARGVKFQFFHKLRAVKTSGGPRHRILEELVFEQQAVLKGPHYDPRAEIESPEDGTRWRVWPNQPNWDQIEADQVDQSHVDYEAWDDEGKNPKNTRERVLRRGSEKNGFDYAVWALPSSMIPLVGDAGMQEEWKPTIDLLPHTATQAVQLWLTEDTAKLGWPRAQLPRPTSRYASGSFPNPLSGMVAYDDLIRFERWPNSGPQGLIYLCAPIQAWPDRLTREEHRLRVRQSASATLRLLGNFLVGARLPESDRPDPQAIDFGYLYDPDSSHRGEARLAYQYFRVNTRPTEAYIRAPAGSVLGRRDAWDCGYRNLTVAGDWMYNGFNLGSFESAVSGGKLAAFALLGTSRAEIDELESFTFLHPRARGRAEDAVHKRIVPMIR